MPRAARATGGGAEPLEQQQHRVTAPLQEVRALHVGDVDQGGEHRVQDVAELLGAGPALLREPLGQAREARDVEQHQAGVELPVRQAVAGGGPSGQQPGQVGRVLGPNQGGRCAGVIVLARQEPPRHHRLGGVGGVRVTGDGVEERGAVEAAQHRVDDCHRVRGAGHVAEEGDLAEVVAGRLGTQGGDRERMLGPRRTR